MIKSREAREQRRNANSTTLVAQSLEAQHVLSTCDIFKLIKIEKPSITPLCNVNNKKNQL